MNQNDQIASLFNAVQLQNYRYHLPEEKIARYPLPERDQSKLLVYQTGEVQHNKFYQLPEILPAESLLVFNNTKVIPARLFFQKDTGATIELFLLQPEAPSREISQAMQASSPVQWVCMIGNLKRWKEDQVLTREVQLADQEATTVSARLTDRARRLVEFSWSADQVPFAELVQVLGEVPLPPYLNRNAEPEDAPRYQTVYSREAGAVAAPTAGLHFTDQVLEHLQDKGIQQTQLTLHVSAGTFQPIKADQLHDHPMHREQVVVNKENIEAVIQAGGPVVSVGTTSMRTMESLYWYGVKLLENKDARFFIEKDFAYRHQPASLPSRQEAFRQLLHYMKEMQLEKLYGETEIFIIPGYTFRVCDGLVTNFHQPESTLVLLIAAFLGDDWKKVYQAALDSNYRFLSFGDSSLLLPAKNH